MSLLQSEEFAIFQLRTSYLANIHDGVGERLINIDTTFLNDPAYKAAGWSANPPELKRCYSPPIPTKITADYFRAPSRLRGGAAETDLPDDDDEGGMVTGVTSNEATRPPTSTRRRRRREQLDEDDSSGLSDESDESDDDVDDDKRPANSIRFAKMPERDRSGSSPLRTPHVGDEGPDLTITSPSKPPDHPQQRRGSLGAVHALRNRERRDTTTSSEISSENDLDPSVFQRREIKGATATRSGGTLTDRIKEDDEEEERPEVGTDLNTVEETPSSDESSLASFSDNDEPAFGFTGSPEDLDSPELTRKSPPGGISRLSRSPERPPPIPEELPELPPPRPISTILPKSALAAAIKASHKKPSNPFDRFATLSGLGEPSPLYIKIYLPPECHAEKPLELMLRRMTTTGAPVTVAEALGFTLWRYGDEGIKPEIPAEKMNVNWWTMRIVEDEEVDFDFPPLSRQRPVSDFTSTNNRPPRRPTTNKPWDEFALVEATEQQLTENEKVTPLYSKEAAATQEASGATSDQPQRPGPARQPSASDPTTSRTARLRRNPVTDPMFLNTALRKDSALPAADAPVSSMATSHAAPRAGAEKTLNVHFIDNHMTPLVVPIPVTTDTYIAEVFDSVCMRLNIDKALYVLKVTNTTTVAPADRTVEALGSGRQSLDLVRRRFIGDGTFGLSGSPGSTSPNAPLLFTSATAPRRPGRRRDYHTADRPLAIANIDPAMADPEAGILTLESTFSPNYKRYNVIRKQPRSFAPSQQRVLALDGEYLTIMPADTGRDRIWDAGVGKTASIHFSAVVGTKISRKHPRAFRVVVFKEGRENKRYDFEAGSKAEAAEIVEEIGKGMLPFRNGEEV